MELADSSALQLTSLLTLSSDFLVLIGTWPTSIGDELLFRGVDDSLKNPSTSISSESLSPIDLSKSPSPLLENWKFFYYFFWFL